MHGNCKYLGQKSHVVTEKFCQEMLLRNIFPIFLVVALGQRKKHEQIPLLGPEMKAFEKRICRFHESEQGK